MSDYVTVPRCPSCHGQPVVAEMGCFGPKSFKRCDTCHGGGEPVLCGACKIEGGTSFATAVYSHVPLCDEHANKCKHNWPALLCATCASEKRERELRVEAQAEAAQLISTLFDAIKHGDEKHQAWLKEAIDDHFRPLKKDVHG